MIGERPGQSEPMSTHETTRQRALRIRQSLAMPFYATALALSYLSDGLGKLAAVIAGDP